MSAYRPTPEEIESLDKDGYVVIEGLLSSEYIDRVKSELRRIRSHQGSRSGEYGFSVTRERLIQKKRFLRLKCFDALFLLLKAALVILVKILPQIRQIIALYTRLPMDYRHVSNFQREVRQMLVCIVEQMDDPNDRRICDLVNQGEVFDIFYQHEKVLCLVKHVIGDDFKLSSLNLRDPRGGNENQHMHVDYPWSVNGEKFYACNALWVLDDMNMENGATRVVSGTHKSGTMPYEGMTELKANHPDQILIAAKAGDVIFLNSHVWHGGTENLSNRERAIIQTYFVHRAHTPQQFQRFQLRKSTRARLGQQALDILDVHKKCTEHPLEPVG